MVVLSRKMTNHELMAIESVKEAVKNGSVVLIDKVLTSNPEYTNLYFFGNVEGLGGAALVNEVQAQFLGWNNSTQQRCIQNASSEIAEKYAVGTEFKDFGIQVFDSTVPEYEGHNPREDSEENLLTSDGKPIYRKTVINTKEKIAVEGHITLKVTERVNKETGNIAEQVKGVSMNALLDKVQV